MSSYVSVAIYQWCRGGGCFRRRRGFQEHVFCGGLMFSHEKSPLDFAKIMAEPLPFYFYATAWL